MRMELATHAAARAEEHEHDRPAGPAKRRERAGTAVRPVQLELGRRQPDGYAAAILRRGPGHERLPGSGFASAAEKHGSGHEAGDDEDFEGSSERRSRSAESD